MASNFDGVKGYICSRPFLGERVPQHVQNLVIRDYCQRNGLEYLLSATEYAMPGCFMILNQLIDEISDVAGIVAYSLFMMPEKTPQREHIFCSILNAGRSLHFAMEGLKVSNAETLARVEDIWRVRLTIPNCPRTLS